MLCSHAAGMILVRRFLMLETALKKKAMDYFEMLDNEQAQMVISYMETIEFPTEKRQHSLTDLKGKIQFADGYDYKAMRSSQ